MDFRNYIRQKLQTVLEPFLDTADQIVVELEHPTVSEFGDYSTSIALELFATVKGDRAGVRV